MPKIDLSPKYVPILDPGFVAPALWNREFRRLLQESDKSEPLSLGLEREGGTTSVLDTDVFPHCGEWVELNRRYVERLVKFLLWQKGGFKLTVAGDAGLGSDLSQAYSPGGARAFDYEFIGNKVNRQPLEVAIVPAGEAPPEREASRPIGRHRDGYRIGFDLGGSDRKCAAVINGELVYSEEVFWDPYFNTNPDWHYAQINDSLKRAAEKLPRVDAIGGSSAGIFVDNEVRVASLFRGVSQEKFDSQVRPIFSRLKKQWGDVPFVVVNDGKVTALAGSMSLKENAVLGVAMGTSLAAGYVTPEGRINDWLDELAFAPVDYNPEAPADEWSGDAGVGALYFSQQAVARLAARAGIKMLDDLPFPVQLVEVQRMMSAGDERARKIYETIGTWFGYTVAHYADFYELRNVLVLGRVVSGSGGDLIVSVAQKVLRAEFPEIGESVRLTTLSEQEKRHGQAAAAASLPELG